MKINSIKTIHNNTYNSSFKRTAIPYPEFENAYLYNKSDIEDKRFSLIEKISELFSPKVTKEANEIKSNIDKVYSSKSLGELPPKKQLLYVFA